MAGKKNEMPEEEEGPRTVGYDETQFEWDTIHEEAPDKMSFDTAGDKYIGEYLGHELIYPSPDDPNPARAAEWFIVLKWRDPEGTKVTNAGYELRTTYVNVTVNDDGSVAAHEDRIPVGSMTRTELIKLVDVKQQEPMKSYRVDVARPVNGSKTSAVKSVPARADNQV
jgi:hypothetical protein